MLKRLWERMKAYYLKCKEQVAAEEARRKSGDPFGPSKTDSINRVNPGSGLPMSSGGSSSDVSGNPFGSSGFNY